MEPEAVERRLAALVSGDVVGYSRLMARDEEATVRTLTACRRDIRRLVDQHRGRLVDFIGDNFFAEFASAVDAVRCAVEIQLTLKERNADLDQGRKMRFRLGAHMGDIRVQGERIYGGDVNITARLEGLANPGGICISQSIHNQVQDKLDLRFKDLGQQSVKNIPEPVRVFRVHIEGQETPLWAMPRTWRGRLMLFALPAVLALGLVLLLLNRLGDPAGPAAVEAAAEINVRRSVAVLGFQNLSGRPADDWLSVAFAEMLSAELGASSREVRTIAGENVARAKLELALAGSAALAGDTLARVHSLLGADYVILGSYLMVPGTTSQLRLDLNLQDAAAGTTMNTLTETGSPEAILDLVSVMGRRLRAELGIGELSEVAAGLVSATISRDPEALRLYSEGLRSLRAYDFITARDRFAEAIRADPEHPLAHAAMAETWSALGYDQEAQEEAQKAFELSAELSREDRLFVEGRHHEMAKRWEKAIESYRSLYLFFPDNLDYGLRLAGALTKAGKGMEAIEALEQLRRLPAPSSDDVRIELAEAEAAESFSDYRRMLAAGIVAAEKGEALGAGILEAGGRLFQGSALLRLGEPKEAADAVGAARWLFAAAGDRSGEARALNRLANVSYEAGDYGEAKRIFEETLEIWRQVGDLEGLITALNNVASTLMLQGDLAAAKPLFEEALGIAKERDDQVSETLMNSNLADLAFRQGDLAEARAIGQVAVQLGRDINYGYGIYTSLMSLGKNALAAGDLEPARRHLEDGLALTREIGERRFEAYFLFSLGQVASVEGDLKLARQRQERALEIREALGSRTESAESKVELALLAVDEGRPLAAVAGLEESIEVFSSLGLSENEAYALAVLVSSSLAGDRLDQASTASRRAEELLSGNQFVALRLWSEIQIARNHAAQGDVDRALLAIESTLADARQRGLVLIEYQARLARAQMASTHRLELGEPDPLAQLAADAEAKGFLLISGKAAQSDR